MSEDDGSSYHGVIRSWRATPDYSEREVPEPWRSEAVCHGADPELFFPHKAKDAVHYSKARLFCDRCPVTEPCLEYAIANHITHGMFGGTTPMERRVIVRQRRVA